jgi:hypothetical protein
MVMVKRRRFIISLFLPVCRRGPAAAASVLGVLLLEQLLCPGDSFILITESENPPHVAAEVTAMMDHHCSNFVRCAGHQIESFKGPTKSIFDLPAPVDVRRYGF